MQPAPEGAFRYVAAVACVAAAVLLSTGPLKSAVGPTSPFLIYFAAVTAAGWYGGFGPAVLATILGAFFARYFALEPVGSLALDLVMAERLGVFALSGVFIAYLTQRLHVLVAEAREASARFQAIVEGVRDYAIYTVDGSGRVSSWNAGAERLYGYGRDEILGLSLGTFMLGGDPSGRVRAILRDALEHGSHQEEDWRRRKDGTFFWAVESVTPLRDPSGGLQGYVCVTRDVSERKRMEDQLRTSERHFRTLLEVAPIHVWKMDAEGRLTFISERLAEHTGVPAAELLGDGWVKIIHPDDLPRVREIWTRVFTEALPELEVECRVRGADGAYRWFLARGVRLAEGTKAGYLGASVDVDDKRRGVERLEEAVAERTKKLQEALGELRAFSHTVSHNLRAPLRAMQGFAHVVARRSADKLDPSSVDLLERIEAAAGRMDLLIRDFLAFADVVDAPATREPVDLDSLLLDIVSSYPQLSSADVRICFPLGTVQANEALLLQALTNILVNAVTFVPEGRRPVVKVWSGQDSKVRLWIEDNGEGIDPALLDKVFETFVKGSSRPRGGTGMGLAIAKKAVERMGGRLGVDSEKGKGTRFWLEVPLAQ